MSDEKEIGEFFYIPISRRDLFKLAGVTVAVNSARKGAKTVLIERSIALDGLGVIGCVYPFMQTHAPNSDTPYLAEVKKRLLEKGIDYDDKATGQTWHNPEILSLIHDEMCEESGVNILYETVVVDCVAKKGKISAVIVQTIAGLSAAYGWKNNIAANQIDWAKIPASQRSYVSEG